MVQKPGSTINHANLSRNRVARLIELARAKKISDLTPSRVQAALKGVRDKGVRDHENRAKGGSLRSVHHYTRVLKGFSRWLWRDGRVREDALAHLTSLNPDADRRHERRALTPEEQARLIRAAEAGPIVLKTSGADRAALYRLALGTGFRANELRSLTPEAFHLDADTPTVTVAAAYSKRRRDDVQPIRPDLAEALRPWLATKPPGRPVFGNLTKHTNLIIQADLKAAGIAYRDSSDRVADFHALRHSFITALAMSKAPVKVIQSLARHSTPTLTLGVYAHVGLFDQTSALDALPGQDRPAPETTEAAALAPTGTESGSARAAHGKRAGVGTGRNESVRVAILDDQAVPTYDESTGRNPLEMTALDGPSRDETERRGWDSNPRLACTNYGFQDRPDRPLWHPSEFLTEFRCQLLAHLVEHVLGHEDRHVHCHGDGDGVAGAGVDLDQLAFVANPQLGEVGVVS